MLHLIAIPAFAQELTSDITGTVTNGAGTPISGATASITFDSYGYNGDQQDTTSSNGRYNAGGLKPGGPYTIEVIWGLSQNHYQMLALIVGDTFRSNVF